MLLSLDRADHVTAAREADEAAAREAETVDVDAMTPEQRFAYVAAYEGE